MERTLITVLSSSGNIQVGSDGAPVPDDAFIARFDLKEYQKRYGKLPDKIDICDLGFWTHEQRYTPADEKFRKLQAENGPAIIATPITWLGWELPK